MNFADATILKFVKQRAISAATRLSEQQVHFTEQVSENEG
jgi:hypothetical protein